MYIFDRMASTKAGRKDHTPQEVEVENRIPYDDEINRGRLNQSYTKTSDIAAAPIQPCENEGLPLQNNDPGTDSDLGV